MYHGKRSNCNKRDRSVIEVLPGIMDTFGYDFKAHWSRESGPDLAVHNPQRAELNPTPFSTTVKPPPNLYPYQLPFNPAINYLLTPRTAPVASVVQDVYTNRCIIIARYAKTFDWHDQRSKRGHDPVNGPNLDTTRKNGTSPQANLKPLSRNYLVICKLQYHSSFFKW